MISRTSRLHTNVLEGCNSSSATKTSKKGLLTCFRVGPLEFACRTDIGGENIERVELCLDGFVACHGGDVSLICSIDDILIGQSSLLLATPFSRKELQILTTTSISG